MQIKLNKLKEEKKRQEEVQAYLSRLTQQVKAEFKAKKEAKQQSQIEKPKDQSMNKTLVHVPSAFHLEMMEWKKEENRKRNQRNRQRKKNKKKEKQEKQNNNFE